MGKAADTEGMFEELWAGDGAVDRDFDVPSAIGEDVVLFRLCDKFNELTVFGDEVCGKLYELEIGEV